MNIAVAVITLHLASAGSLKEKRGILQSLMTRLRDRYNLSVAEVADQDEPRSSQIGLSAVNTSYVQAHEAVQRAVRFMEDELVGRGQVVGIWQEVLGGFGELEQQ